MQERIEALFQLWKDHPGAGGQVLVTYKGETVFEKCYGYANIETGTEMTPESIFHVASVTKQFTAMSILILHERGKLSVYDDVRKYIPDLIAFSEPLSIKQLMNHVSGLREYYDLFYLGGRSMEDHLAQHEARRLIARQTGLNFAPGTEFLYTNANYMFLATIVERVSGMDFGAFVKENIFVPLGMEKSFFRDDPRMLVPNKVSSYHDNGYGYTNAILTFGLYGGTGLHTTCRELHRFLGQYMAPTLISRETMENIMFHIPEIGGKKGNYGCGVRVNELEGHRFIHHGGVNAGYRTVGAVYPEDELVITVFANTYNIPVETAARKIARIVLGLPLGKPKNLDAYRTDTVDLTDVSGLYYCDRNRDNFTLSVEDGNVYLDGVILQPVGGNIYKQGRRNISVAIGDPVVVNQDGNIMILRKLDQQLSPEQARQYVGRYYNEEAQATFRVVLRTDGLWLEHIRHRPAKLNWLEADQFFHGMYRETFCRDENGKVTGYLFNSGHLRDILLTKIQ